MVAFALGWLALAAVVSDPDRGGWSAAGYLGLAALVHPSLGLQLAMLVAVSLVAFVLIGIQSPQDAPNGSHSPSWPWLWRSSPASRSI